MEGRFTGVGFEMLFSGFGRENEGFGALLHDMRRGLYQENLGTMPIVDALMFI